MSLLPGGKRLRLAGIAAGVLAAFAVAVVDPADAAACQRPYADTSPWNTPIGSSPAYDPNTAVHVGALTGTLTSDPTQYTYPVYEVTSETPRETVTLSGVFSNVTNGGATLAIQRGGTVQLPIPAGARAAAGTDAQIIIVDPATGDEWGAWRLAQDAAGSWTATNGYHYNTRWSGVPPVDAAGRPFGSRGAGVPYLAGLVRPCEIVRGRIDHALAFAYDYPTGDFVYPAAKSDGKSLDPADLPEGARLQLDPTLTAVEIQAWGCTGPCLTIARALQEYGMYVIDNSGRPKVMMEYEGTAAWNGLVTAKTVSPIPLSAFKVLDLGRSPSPPPPSGSPPPPPPPASGSACTVIGTPGADRLAGTAGRDVICALGGDDEVRGLGGDDVIYAGAGADLVLGGRGADRIVGGLGRDRLYGGPGADTLVARDRRRDVLSGGLGRDRARVDTVDLVRTVESRF